MQLAAMYQNALHKGAPVGLMPLTTSILSGNTPKVTSTHLEIPSPQSQYSYYFFPLDSFDNELRNNHGYKTIVSGFPFKDLKIIYEFLKMKISGNWNIDTN